MDPEEYRVKKSQVRKYFFPVTGAAFGIGTVMVSNYYNRRPYHAGIQRHFVLGIAGMMIGYYMDKFLERKWANRDAMIRHYIELHPEDFVDKRKKYKEIFGEWYPQR